MREEPKWGAAIAEQQGRFFVSDVAASLTSHIDYVKGNGIIPAQALPDIVWYFPSLKVSLIRKQASSQSHVHMQRSMSWWHVPQKLGLFRPPDLSGLRA